MCITCEMDDKWPPFIEFMVWFTTMGLNIGNHFGVWAIIKSNVIDVTQPLYRNATRPNITSFLNLSTLAPMLNVASRMPSSGEKKLGIELAPNRYLENATFFNETELVIYKSAEEQWETLIIFRMMFLVFCGIGATLFFLHLIAILPNVIQSFRVKEPTLLKDSDHIYFKNVLKIHCVFLLLETILFDIPAGCIVMEILSLIWEGPLSNEQNMEVSKIIMGMSLVGLAFIALYKGMMPLFLWIGNPFCFPCIPLRLLVVFPGGLIALVMTFGPAMGVLKNRLLQFAPPMMQAEVGEMARTFFSIGMIFWGVVAIVLAMTAFCWYKVCREGAEIEDVCGLLCCP